MPIINSKSYMYTVKRGDTLYAIARRFGSTVEAIEQANHLYPPVTDRELVFPEDVLVVPTDEQIAIMSYVVFPGDGVRGIAASFQSSVDLVAGINRLDNPNLIYIDQLLLVPAFTYEIESGDTLYRIARRFGMSVEEIEQANSDRPGFQRDVIWAGYNLVIPIPTSENIFVTNPLPGVRIRSGQSVEGFARAFEAAIQHELHDSNGGTVSNERFTITDEGAPAYGYFASTLLFDQQPTSNSGELWIYTRSAQDDSISDLVKTRIYF
ncbi:LysM peptidoglycan-binding domain-containing protein [Thalassobacillus devorans]|uniref:LysM peptidoglycan-binding domain-containing protein n=1 Tax=Thalassobacillus devorans TaxID=279813 RepID=UPI00048F3941|nr:LysM peptidoglycan-binding domain-containing protein [Thalassobacillus devorans]